MLLCNKAHGVTLGGERDERKPTMHIQSDSLTCRAQAYIYACLGFLLALLFTTLSLLVYDFHTGKERFHGRSVWKFGVFVI